MHHGRTDFTRRRRIRILAHAIVVQHTATTQTMRRLAILIPTLLHVLPEFNHLTAVLGFARRTSLALARVAKEQ